jgi:hypothetical protein
MQVYVPGGDPKCGINHYSGPCAEKSPLSIVCMYPFVSVLDPFVSSLTRLFPQPVSVCFCVTRFRLFDLFKI